MSLALQTILLPYLNGSQSFSHSYHLRTISNTISTDLKLIFFLFLTKTSSLSSPVENYEHELGVTLSPPLFHAPSRVVGLYLCLYLCLLDGFYVYKHRCLCLYWTLSLTLSFFVCLCVCVSVCLSVCLFALERRNYRADFNKTFPKLSPICLVVCV